MTYLGIDLGTSSVKAILVSSSSGEITATERVAYKLDVKSGSAEIATEAWWDAVVRAVRAATSADGNEPIQAIGVTGQMHGVVVADPDGRALRPAITWADGRAQGLLERFRALPEHVRDRLGNPVAPGMAGPILLWLAENETTTFDAARWALQPKDWLRFQLTGRAAADPSDASATLLYDVYSDDWALEAVRLLGLRERLLPELQPSLTVAGELSDAAARVLGVAAGTPVAIGAADTAAALLAAGIAETEALINVGSGGQIVEPTCAPSVHPLHSTQTYRAVGPGWYAMAAVQSVGVALEWTLNALQSSWAEIYETALPQTVPGADDLVFIPYVVGERGPGASQTGAWLGLRSEHTRSHLLRAALEGVSYALREGLDRLEEIPGRFQTLWLAGGSTRWPSWRQMLADVLGRPLSLASANSAYGAAMIAAAAVGDPFPPTSSPSTVIEPGEASSLYQDRYAQFLELVTEQRATPARRLLGLDQALR